MAISDDIRRGEGYELEFKLIPNEDRVKYLKTAVAFANGKGGSILFGVANDGTVHGIDKRRVSEELAAYGAKPLQIEDGGIDVRINVFRNAALRDEGNEDNRHGERGSRAGRQKSTLKEIMVNEKVNERQKEIITIVSDNPYITQSELSSRLGISLVHVNKNMKKLQVLGVIRRVGPDKGGHWEVV